MAVEHGDWTTAFVLLESFAEDAELYARERLIDFALAENRVAVRRWKAIRKQIMQLQDCDVKH